MRPCMALVVAVCRLGAGDLLITLTLLALGSILMILLAPGMLPMLGVRLRLGTLLSADTGTLAPAVLPNKLAVITHPFTASENLSAGDLTLASGGGLDPIAGVAGAQGVGVDPATLEQVIEISPPAGGFRWVTSGGGPYPKTVYGYALLDNTLANLFGVTQLTLPITLSADGQFVEFEPAEMRFVMQPMS